MTSTIFVAGASSFIGKHIVNQLLEKGYRVIGSVRSEEKGERLQSLIENTNFQYVVVEETEAKGAFDQALINHPETNVFIDTASPVPIGVDYEKQLIKRTANGVKNILTSIKDHGPNVRRVILTSSIASCMNEQQSQDPNFVVDETKWNPDKHSVAKDNSRSAYFYAKAAAEHEAWDFMKKTPQFALSTILPAYTFGPQCFDEDVSDILEKSVEIVSKIFELNKNDPIPDEKGLFVDVRDVASAHIQAFEKDDAENKRLMLVAEAFSAQEIVDILHKLYPGAQLPTGHPGERVGYKFDNTQTKQILDIHCRSLESSIKDDYDQYLRTHGIIS
ncbi:GRP2 putative NADPH-dependent methylglyoxal reductase GRP2 [Candida maltosa Xu316]|uniref:NAD-dependent epimerase/dehydratase domain-containing protein n=1 Tax=Candida maltosa (strain Xu316) TaxID=1245528 RepID=M3HNI5_CANMX|nr:hypothetical protein G210_0293 [Candida maltosa Xu316]